MRCLSLSINFLHAVPIVFTISTASILVANQNANANGGICNRPIYKPPHCIGYEDGNILEGFEIPCGCGRDGAVQQVPETTNQGMQQPAGGNRESCSKRKERGQVPPPWCMPACHALQDMPCKFMSPLLEILPHDAQSRALH